MDSSDIIAIGSIIEHRGTYDNDTVYYYKNQVSMYGSVFEALSDNFSGVAPLAVADDGSVSLSNTTTWKCVINNVDLYNKTLATNALDTRVTTIENSITNIQEVTEKMKTVVQDSQSDDIDNYSEVISFLNGYKDSETLKGVVSDITSNIDDHSKEIAMLELKHLNPKLSASASSVAEYVEGETSTAEIEVTAVTDEGSMSDNSDFVFNAAGLEYASSAGTLSESHTSDTMTITASYSEPVTDTVTVEGKCTYKGYDVSLSKIMKTINCVKASYIGYSLSADSLDVTGSNVQKIVKKSLAGSYSVTNALGEQAYLIIAVPKNGNVDSVNGIVQRSSMSVNQPFNTVDTDDYTLYVCSTKHNEGTYTFVIS